MVRNRWLIVAATFGLITAALLTVWSSTTSGQAPNRPAMATWEYMNVFGTVRQDNADELNRFGKEGWEDLRGLGRWQLRVTLRAQTLHPEVRSDGQASAHRPGASSES